jgi:tripartite-type tricarboxylate transporter receptor subunit TctC
MAEFIRISRAVASVLAVGAAALTAFASQEVQAQSFPQRPITIVVGAAAGGSGDVAARLIAEPMAKHLGGKIVVENVPGAGGITGTGRVARAEPDGYTLLIQQTGLATLPALHPNLNFNVEKDLTVIGMVNNSYSFVVGRKDLSADTLPQFVAWAKGLDRPVKLAHPGVGSFGHLASIMFAKSTGIQADLIAYRGVAPAMTDIAGGHVDAGSGSAPVTIPLIQAGQVKAFAYTGEKRHRILSTVPTFVDLGHPELSRPLWHALFAPAGTPQPVIERLNAALRAALEDPMIRQAYLSRDVEPFPAEQMSPAAGNAYVRGEIERWGKVIRDAGIKANP